MRPFLCPMAIAALVLASCSSNDVELRDPITLDADQYGQWVWIDEPGMRCSNDERGGFAVNFTEESRELVIYLQGGGICYNSLTCLVGGAATSVGEDPIAFALDGGVRSHRGIFSRDNEDNPFRSANFVVVPHCTGDHHTGNRVAEYEGATFHHVGYTNITRMLERVVPTFKDASRVVLTGFSAGGVGITANYHQLARAFDSVGQPPPYLISDAGPFLRPPYLETSAQEALREAWNLDETVGSFCPSCLTDGFHDLYRVNGDLHPGLRSSLLATYDDGVVRLLYGVLNESSFSSEQMREGLLDLTDWGERTLGPQRQSQHRFFYFEGESHGVLGFDSLFTTPELVDFLNEQLGSGDWTSVRD